MVVTVSPRIRGLLLCLQQLNLDIYSDVPERVVFAGRAVGKSLAHRRSIERWKAHNVKESDD